MQTSLPEQDGSSVPCLLCPSAAGHGGVALSPVASCTMAYRKPALQGCGCVSRRSTSIGSVGPELQPDIAKLSMAAFSSYTPYPVGFQSCLGFSNSLVTVMLQEAVPAPSRCSIHGLFWGLLLLQWPIAYQSHTSRSVTTLTMLRKEGRKFTHPWQPTRLNGWSCVCLSSA